MRRFLYALSIFFVAVHSMAGAWGAGSFDNDDALDWARGFEEPPSDARAADPSGASR